MTTTTRRRITVARSDTKTVEGFDLNPKSPIGHLFDIADIGEITITFNNGVTETYKELK